MRILEGIIFSLEKCEQTHSFLALQTRKLEGKYFLRQFHEVTEIHFRGSISLGKMGKKLF